MDPGMDQMQSGGPPSLAEGAELMAELATAIAVREDAVRRLVFVLADVNRAGVVEALEGLPLDVQLAVQHGFTGAEQAMLLDAGDVLASMPATTALWQQGRLSWSMVRDVVARLRRFGRDMRVSVDQRIGASEELVGVMDPERFAWAVAEAVEELHGTTAKERAEDADAASTFLWVQMGLDGRSKLYGELDAPDTAVVLNGLDRQAARDDRTTADDTGAAQPRTAHGRHARRRTRAKRRGRALVGLCADRLAGRTATGRRVDAKPLMVVHVPLDRVSTTAAGRLEVAVDNALPTLSARTVEALARDADVRAVVMDGARPLTVTRRLHAREVPEDTLLAVRARDLGARDPAGRTSIPLSEVHHLTPGLHHPDRLACVSQRGHLRLIHRHGWSGHVDTTSGWITWSRGNRNIVTVPWGTPLNRSGTGSCECSGTDARVLCEGHHDDE